MDDKVVTYSHNSALTEIMLRNARKSLNEVAELTGLPVQEVSERYARLFEDRGWRTDRQEERLLLMELGDFLQDARKRMEDATNEDFAGIARVVISGLKLMADRFDKRKRLVDEDINLITQANARLFGSAYEIAVMEIADGLIVLYPEIEFEEVMSLARSGLEKAKSMLQANVSI